MNSLPEAPLPPLRSGARRAALTRLLGAAGCAGSAGRWGMLAGAWSGCSSQPIALSHGFYIWQHVWQPPLLAAVQQAQADVAQWRVLGLHLDAGRWRQPRVVLPALAGSGKPVRLVVRVEGHQTPVWDEAWLATLRGLWATWQAQGVALAGLEIDHDAGERQLPRYEAWLRRLRQAWPEVSLSITALPAWLHAAGLSGVLQVVDEAVLQVHAANRPGRGLFEAEQARQWVSRWAREQAKPFSVALPCYGNRVVFDEQGAVVALESETPVPVRSGSEQQLLAQPTAVSALLSWLSQADVPQLRGVMWFRLPTDQDQRAWRLSTWRAVVHGQQAWPEAQVKLHATATPGLWDVVLRNPSDVDLALPRQVALPRQAGGQGAFGGVQGYSADLLSPEPRLSLRDDGWLRPQAQFTIGWLRSTQPLDHAQLTLPLA
ncbi:MAG: hypothetical protein RI907_506 [Pseudomonadota bacterium]|jgi:hypothetical protein